MGANNLLVKDVDYMRQALEQARQAQARGEVPVGAVIVARGEIVGVGNNRNIVDNDPTAHAEIVAMRDAGRSVSNHRLLGSTLYVTLEPCVMCAGALLHARVERLVFGASDPLAGAAGGRFETLLADDFNHKIQVDGGVLRDECSQILKDFFAQRR